MSEPFTQYKQHIWAFLNIYTAVEVSEQGVLVARDKREITKYKKVNKSQHAIVICTNRIENFFKNLHRYGNLMCTRDDISNYWQKMIQFMMLIGTEPGVNLCRL